MSTVIPIDGPTSSGKSSVGYLFAKDIGFQYIDSGAIYRAGAIAVAEKGIDLSDEEKITQIFSDLKIEFKIVDQKQHTFLNGKDISLILHNPEVTSIVPTIGAYAPVRLEVIKLQRRITESENTVMAGRDIGTESFPDARLKFYLTADMLVRANRRLTQLKEKVEGITFEEVLEQMIERDKADMIRKVAPLRIPPDAVIIDTTIKTTEETVNVMLEHYDRVYGKN